MKMPSNVLNFASSNGLKGLHDIFADYWSERRTREGVKGLSFSSVDEGGNPISYDEKDHRLNRIFRKEVCRIAKVDDMSELGLAQWSTNPTVFWAAFAVVSSLIDYVLPTTLIESIGAYTDIRTAGFGDNFKFDVKPRDLFPVTKASRNKRTAELQRQYNGTVTLTPENRMVTVYVSLYRILSGQESLGDFVAKAVLSMESEMTYDAYTAFNTAMTSLPTTPADGELKLPRFYSMVLVYN